MLKLSVIIPTYNPCISRLRQTVQGLQLQSLPPDEWELIIVDNNSSNDFMRQLELDWHPSAKIVCEPKQGLTYARLKGFREAAAGIIVMVDDDNVLNSNYLETVLSILHAHPKIAAIGGKTVPVFETPPPAWLYEFYGSLALRDLGGVPVISRWQNIYPYGAPIGAGMGLRRKAMASYMQKIASGRGSVSDRRGDSLSSGGDNDMVIEILKSGWQVGYFPELELQHIIPPQRMTVKYLARLLHNTNRSWVGLLEAHRINPWSRITKTGALIRKAKAWVTYSAWKSAPGYIRWRGACGTFDGLSSMPRK